MAVRAATPHAFGRTAFLGNDGLEYWFPRPHSDTAGSQASIEDEQNELVILGGAREATKGRGFEFYEVDDSVVHPEVSASLRKFLPAVFPAFFQPDREPEIEWVSITWPLTLR